MCIIILVREKLLNKSTLTFRFQSDVYHHFSAREIIE